MNVTLLFGLAFVVSTSAFAGVQRFYHKTVGIPTAQRIKEFEEGLLAGQKPQDGRIVGGNVAAANAHPYLAGLVISFANTPGVSGCGSTLVSPNRLITAAHCWFDGDDQGIQFVVVLGSLTLFTGGIRIPTRTVIMHPQWNPFTLRNDIAMIYLPSSVSYSNSIRPASLPTSSELSDTFAGLWAMASGYGMTSDQQTSISWNSVVSEVRLRVITVAQCQAEFGVFAPATTICTSGVGGVGICGGDSGGPLVVTRGGRQILVGVSSFRGWDGCEAGEPSGFTRITSYNSFINQHL